MRKTLGQLFLVSTLLGILSACNDSASTTADDGTLTFEVRGVVQEIKEGVLVIDHEEMPEYMQAMIMPFRVKEGHMIDVEAGDQITFRYVVEEYKSWIENLEKTGKTGEIKTAVPVEIDEDKLVKIGDPLPDYEFFDQTGKKVNLSDYQGGPVVLTFVFSTCPVPEYCPAMMRNFAQVQKDLAADADAPENWHLLTISFDTINDTPEVMANYGKMYEHDPALWSLLSTNHCCTIDDIAANVGLLFGEKNGSLQHNLRTVVLDKTGNVKRIFTDENWTVEELISEIKKQG
ncbi:MAG: SCO family protein [Verrucomicrobiota bacterium]